MTPLWPDWPAPPGVRCLVSTRPGGLSEGPFASLNLGDHVGDDPAAVRGNRAGLLPLLAGAEPQWIRQVHGSSVLRLDERLPADRPPPEADALYTRRPGLALAVLTADCLPVCLAAADGSEVAVAHAGWRGLAAGILENTLACFVAPPGRIQAWLGPAIGPCHFEVGEEVRRAFLGAEPAEAPAGLRSAFRPGRPGRWMADLYALAAARLRAAGLNAIHGGGLCTVCDAARFYSYRRDGATGRFATLIQRLPEGVDWKAGPPRALT